MELIWLIPLFPLIGFITNGLLGRKMPKSLVSLTACGSVFLSFALSIYVFIQLLGLPARSRIYEVTLFSWVPAGSFSADMGFLLDPLSAVMILVVSATLFVQEPIARRPRLWQWGRTAFLLVTLVWLGWIAGGQLSVVHVVFFFHSLLNDFLENRHD